MSGFRSQVSGFGCQGKIVIDGQEVVMNLTTNDGEQSGLHGNKFNSQFPNFQFINPGFAGLGILIVAITGK